VSEPDLGPLLQRFEVSAADQRNLAFVRAAAATLSAACSLLLLLGRLPVPVLLAALLGLAMSLAWLAQARRARRLAATASEHHLSLYREGLVVAEHKRLTRVRFADVSDIDVDEERLDIRLALVDGQCVRIEPRYPGVEIHDLVRTLQNALLAARAAPPAGGHGPTRDTPASSCNATGGEVN
jgi:hypothetical protein